MAKNSSKSVTILITTKDRLEDLKITLSSLSFFLDSGGKIIICDDGSKDNTAEVITAEYPQIEVVKNEKCLGLIYSRNRLLSMVITPYAVSLDDDSNFLGADPLSHVISHFSENPNCGVIAFRIFWGTEQPVNTATTESLQRVKSFVGCGHAWRMKAWKAVPDYPDWFNFYGEEEFASFHLFKKEWQVHYLPEILVHHRVDVKSRKNDHDYIQRLRFSLRAGWYLYIIFLPFGLLPRRIFYSIWVQLKLKVFRGDSKALKGILLALKDLFSNMKKVYALRDSLSKEEFKKYLQLEDTKIYWKHNK